MKEDKDIKSLQVCVCIYPLSKVFRLKECDM